MKAGAVVMALFVATGCAKPESTVPPEIDADGNVSPDLVQGGADSAADLVETANPTGTGDASTAAAGDAGLPTDASATQDAADAVALPKLPTICVQEPLVDAPKVDTPCGNKGERRCSDVGAKYWIGPDAQCIRPNVLECTNVANELVWKARRCNDVQKEVGGIALWDKCHYSTAVCGRKSKTERSKIFRFVIS